ncbi:MAG: ATP-binding protein, partial [Myxococcales bacterium]|nr:ATP-binding protein [Myxococcales bacterium]
LGLYIAAAVAKLHGGTLRAKSELGAGATFSLALPTAA